LQNLQIQNNVISAAQRFGTKKLLFLGSACVYPRLAPEPVSESELLNGALEPSNQWYALAKIAGIKLCQAMRIQHGCDFISAMPTNLYGPGDKYDLQSCHVLPALLRRFHEAALAKSHVVTCWGDGTPRREFMYSDDCAEACIVLMQRYSGLEPVNIGTGSDRTIHELASAIASTVGYSGLIGWDCTKPNGTPRRLLDTSKLDSLGWKPKRSLYDGLRRTYADYVESQLLKKPELVYDSMR
jgi:GDP-L-fucose synthase